MLVFSLKQYPNKKGGVIIQYTQTKQIRPWHEILFGLVFALVGIGLLVYSISTIKSYNEKNKTYTETTSVVVDYARDDEGLEAIIVEYTVNGKAYRKQSNSYSNIPKSIGTQVKVKYNPNDPNDAIWVNDSANIVLPLAGGLFALVGIIVVIISVKKMKSERDVPTIQQANGLYNSADIINTIPNNQIMGQQISQQQATQSQQAFQYQQPVGNETQGTLTQNTNYQNQQNQINNQNNMNSKFIGGKNYVDLHYHCNYRFNNHLCFCFI